MRIKFITIICVLVLNMGMAADSQAQTGPFTVHKGLEITRAFTSSFGPDAEEYNKIGEVTKKGYEINYNDTRGTVAKRVVLHVDSKSARTYLIGFDPRVKLVVPGTTSLGLSSAAFEQLRSTGKTQISLMYDTKLSTIPGVLTVVQKEFKVPVLIEQQVVELPALRASGVFQAGNRTGRGDFIFMSDKNQPVLIQYHLNFSWEKRPRTLRTVRVTAGQSQQKAMEQTLKTVRKLDLYGIRFDFGKATIRSDAATVVRDVAKTMQVNPSWKLSIKGHTDSIGGVGYNFKLSEQRALSVKKALVSRGISANRLTSSGLGPSEPKSTNDTLQGRALNRRVELVRTDR